MTFVSFVVPLIGDGRLFNFMVPILSIPIFYPLEILQSTLFFFERLAGTPMNFSEYIQKKMKASNTYKSNWQGRDASEVTLRRGNIANKNNSSVHDGPDNVCCSTTYPGSTVTTTSQTATVNPTWVASANMTGSGTTVTFLTSNDQFSYVYDSNRYTSTFDIQFTVPQTTASIVVGLCDLVTITPPTNYGTNIKFDFLILGTSWYIARYSAQPPGNGTIITNNGQTGTHIVGNIYEIVWDGTYLYWYVNSNLQIKYQPTVPDTGYRAMVQTSGGAVPNGSTVVFSNINSSRPTTVTTTTTIGSTTVATAPKPPQAPGNGFSTDYSMDIVSNKRAGCANCSDTVWGTAGGVNLKSCAEVSTILSVPSNPIKGTNLTISPTNPIITSYCYCADPGVLPNNRGVVVAKDEVNSTTISGQYTGWRNQVPAPDNGSKRRQVIPFPSA